MTSREVIAEPQEHGERVSVIPRTRCPIGKQGECDFERLPDGIDHSGLVPGVWIARCRHCGVGITQPPLQDVAFLYADRSSQDFQSSTRGLTRTIKTFVFRRQARRLLADLKTRPNKVIDFACGSGLFTSCLADTLSPTGHVIACDFHKDPPADLRGVEYRALDNLGDLSETADLVLAMHVIEHDDDPMALLSRIVRLAKPGGNVVIEVPNINCAWTAVFGRWWDAWYLPYHRTHFSRNSLRALIEASGLVIVAEADISVPTMGRTLAKLMHQPNNLVFILLGAVLHPLQLLLEWLTRQPSALRIVARK